ncbi:MAG TPA: sugar phosphate isomerase/epimerase family protein [Chloroflexota bacterium]|nr:sugar phosphate isomerase/epimerase family protein [Chloroflexota bacterium]
MKFAFSTLGCPDWTLEQVATAARDYGYEGVELRLVDGNLITSETVRTNRDRLERLFDAAILPIVGFGSSARFSMTDETERRQNVEAATRIIDVASELGVPLVRVFGGKRPDGVDEATGIDNVVKGLNELATAAERAGVTVALETHDDFSSAVLVSSVMERVPSRAVGVIWDTHHPHRVGESSEQIWKAIGERLVHVHVKDARRNGGGWDLVLLGEGEVPVDEVVNLLRREGYPGFISVEWEKKWHPEIPTPEVALPQHLDKLRSYLT